MFITIVTFILVLGVLILAHELGHFSAARIFKVKAEEFGFGYPPRIFGFVKSNITGRWKRVGRKENAEKFKNTVWSLNWLPLGGFVKIKGEDGDNKQDENSFGSKPVWQRFIMLFAGVFMNFVLCFVLLSAGFMAGIPTMVDDVSDSAMELKNEKVIIMSVAENSPASNIGMQIGDQIFKIDGQQIFSIKEVQEKVNPKNGVDMEIVVHRRGEESIYNIVPAILQEGGEKAQIGVGLVKTAVVSYPWYKAIYKGAENTAGLTVAITKAFGNIIADIFRGNGVQADVAGPVGIAVLTGQVVKLGWIYVLQFMALLSINLAIINILPIPALDGGRILFLIIEKIKGGPVRQKVEGAIHQVGFILLLLLMALVIFKDFRTYGSSMWNAVVNLF
ncbi:MAG: RIP metalloprotease RseP [Candidatus Kuenenbacteria bacterium]